MEFFVPVALTELEALAIKSAAMAVALSSPAMASKNHPLVTASLKIEAEYKKAKEKAEAS